MPKQTPIRIERIEVIECTRRHDKLKMNVLSRGHRKIALISVIVLIFAVLTCFCALHVFADVERNESLKQLIVLFRHGARNPTDTYNSDPYKDYPWPNGRGALTNAGKLQMFTFGKLIQERYNDFIPSNYLDDDTYVLSSDNSRCLMSAYTMLAGLYPPTEAQKWHPDIPWQPIPVHALPRSMDNMIAAKKPCAKLDAEYDSAQKSERIKKLDEDLRDIYEYLTLHTNGTVDNILSLEGLYSVLLVEKENGLKLPQWTEAVFPNKMEVPMRTSLALFSDNDSMKRLRSGPLLGEIMKNMKVIDDRTSRRKLYLYSAHDITIVSMWRTLGFTELLRPEYGSSLILELHKNGLDSPSYIKAFYWNDTTTESPLQLELPLCDEPCTLIKFINNMKYLTPTDWETECDNKINYSE